jgi:serine protease
LKAAGIDSETLARRLRADGDVLTVEVDRRMRAFGATTAAPNDPLFAAGPAVDLGTQTGGPEAGQWYLRAPTPTFRSAADVQGAWALTRGHPTVVIAVLDSGVLADHEDLDPSGSGRVVSGYDFITDTATANDGGGRDGDASDPGDWITLDESQSSEFAGCDPSDSSWHGTHVAGIVGAMADNGIGMAGVAPGARILPVRVLGKCGGWNSDIIAGMRWAAGLPLADVPDNPNPARVLNMSLGGGGACSSLYREAVAAVNAVGAVVVAAAGNSTGHAVGTPANCPGVIAVTGLRHAGSKVGFSDLGPEIAIAAPGGNCVNIDPGQPCLYPILTTTNTGTRTPLAGGSTYTDAFNYSVGTSFATPIVAGTVALMLSVQPNLDAFQIRSVLQATARPFPTEGADNGDDPTPVPVCQAPSDAYQLQCYCVTGLCGAGMLDAAAAVARASSLNAMQSLSGTVRHWGNGAPIPDVEVTLVDADGSPVTTRSSADGSYRFNGVVAGTYQVVASMPNALAQTNKAISLGDAVAAMRMAVGQSPNASPFQIIAADVNGSGSVTSADALALLRRVAQPQTASAQEWFFIESSRSFLNPPNSNGEGGLRLTKDRVEWSRDISVETDGSPLILDLWGGSNGDVDGSWSFP